MEANFSEKAKKALENAAEAAGDLGHRYIGSEHLLLGLIATEGSAAAEILAEENVRFDLVREKLCQLCETGEPISGSAAEITPRARRILQGAVYESRRLGKRTGTEHLLLALSADSDSLAVRLLTLVEADATRLYRACRELLREEEKMDSRGADSPDEKKSGGKKKGPLSEYGHDLTEAARQGKLDPIIGREKEL